jgi:hypothetical protein
VFDWLTELVGGSWWTRRSCPARPCDHGGVTASKGDLWIWLSRWAPQSMAPPATTSATSAARRWDSRRTSGSSAANALAAATSDSPGGVSLPWPVFAAVDALGRLTWALYASMLGLPAARRSQRRPGARTPSPSASQAFSCSEVSASGNGRVAARPARPATPAFRTRGVAAVDRSAMVRFDAERGVLRVRRSQRVPAARRAGTSGAGASSR